jgi:prepilin-type N-terminal cleavage/methylation domain-containing protein
MSRSRQAFTLLEILLVLALLALLLAVAWPTLNRSLETHRLKYAADAVQTRLARARTRAMLSGEIFPFRFQPQTGNFRIEQQSDYGAALAAGGTTAPPASGSPAPNSAAVSSAPSSSAGGSGAIQANRAPTVEEQLPNGIEFVSNEVQTDTRSSLVAANNSFTSITEVPWSEPILFYPDGTATAAKVLLQGQRGRRISISLRSLTGGAKVGEIEVAEGGGR